MMISVVEAKRIISETVKPLPPVAQLLSSSWNHTLAADVVAGQNIPAYPQSSMDGYAIAYSDVRKKLPVAGESAAGNRDEISLQAGTAARIFTGAAVPEGADTVVMQEKVVVGGGSIEVRDDNLVKGMNVRLPGSEIKKGETALAKGTILTAAAIGFLANIGVRQVNVVPLPRVSIIITGNELKPPGESLAYGEVYESNSLALRSVLSQYNQGVPEVLFAKDNADELTGVLQYALDRSDLVLLTGGVSVGEYDFVIDAAGTLGVNTLFHKIKQRPGKPLYYGTLNNKVVFGLPGNPSSVLTCFYEYVTLAIGRMTNSSMSLPVLNVPVNEGFVKKIKFTQFLKGYFNGEVVDVLPAQESFKMNSFAKANCFVVMGEEAEELKKGDIAEIHMITRHV